jgi:hypothetical protein
MGTKYTTTATSGYNSSAPADDGSQSAANLITWAGIKTKLADVLKTFAEAINTKLVSAFDYSVRQITGSDSTVAGDHMRCVEIAPNVSTAVTVSLGDAVTMTNIYRVFIKNSSPLNQTVGRVTSGDTIDGTAGNVTLPPGAGAVFQTIAAATGYVINSWYGPFSDANPVVSGGTDGTKKIRFEVDGLTTATTRVITAPDRDLTLNELAPLTTSLGSNVNLNNTGTYFNGPIVAQGTSGTWFFSGQVSVTDGAGSAAFNVRLTDGTTVIASSRAQTSGANVPLSIPVSGFLTSPAASVMIQVQDVTSTSGVMIYDGSGNAKDCTLTALRIG